MNERIDIYPSIWRVVGVILGGIFVVIGCIYMANHPRYEYERVVGYFGIVFFSLAVIVGLYLLALRAIQKPIALIYNDRLECLILIKMKYEVIQFSDVERFVIFKLDGRFGVNFIRAIFLNGNSKNTIISNAVVSVAKICSILNNKFDDFVAKRCK